MNYPDFVILVLCLLIFLLIASYEAVKKKLKNQIKDLKNAPVGIVTHYVDPIKLRSRTEIKPWDSIYAHKERMKHEEERQKWELAKKVMEFVTVSKYNQFGESPREGDNIVIDMEIVLYKKT